MVDGHLNAEWLTGDIENRVLAYAIEHIVSLHVEEVRTRRLPEIDKIETEVTARLKKEINYWDHRAQDLMAKEQAGKKTRLSSANAQARANDLSDRLQRRLEGLKKERNISALPPNICGGATACIEREPVSSQWVGVVKAGGPLWVGLGGSHARALEPRFSTKKNTLNLTTPFAGSGFP